MVNQIMIYLKQKNKRSGRIVNQLLDKLRPDMIQLNPTFIANLPTRSTVHIFLYSF